MNKTMKIGFVLMVAAALLTAPLFAGGSQGTGTAPAPVGKAEIKLWQHLDAPNDPYFYNLIQGFNDKHPDIHMNFELIPWAGAWDTYNTAFAAGNPADVIFWSTAGWGSQFWDMGVIEDLTPYLAKWQYTKDIPDTAWSSCRAGDNNPIYGVPVMSLPNILYYREDWFKELGLKPPETREDFLTACRAITQKMPGRYGFAMRGARGGLGTMLQFVIPVVGNKWFEADGKTSTFRRPEAIAAAEWFVNLFKTEHVVPPSAPSDGFAEIMDAFHNGLAGMLAHHIMSWSGHVQSLGEENVGIVLIPSINGKRWSGDGGIHHYTVSKASKYKDAAFTFATWMAEPEQNAYYGHYVGSIPVIKGVEKFDDFFSKNKFAAKSLEGVAYCDPAPSLSTMGEFGEREWPQRFQQALLGQITVQQMMTYFAEICEAGLE
jgi:multiple sugar transport system substrate-binding protein